MNSWSYLLIKQHTPIVIDSNKKESVVFMVPFCPSKTIKYSPILGYKYTILKELQNQFNVIIVGGDTELSTEFNYFRPDQKRFDEIKESEFKKKGEIDNHFLYNYNIIKGHLRDVLKVISELNVKYIVNNDEGMWLPMMKYKLKEFKHEFNEFFDYTGDDLSIIQKKNEYSEEVSNNIHRHVNILAYSQVRQAFQYCLIDVLVEMFQNTLKSFDNFVIDPVNFAPYYNNLPVPNRNLYFVDDNRGTRNFQKFPIGQLQHVYHDEAVKTINPLDDEDPIVKDKIFIHYSSLFHEKGSRLDLWNLYFKDLRIENSSLFIPMKSNGFFFKSEKELNGSQRLISEMDKLYKIFGKELVDEVNSHPMYCKWFKPEQCNDILKQYRYSTIIRCMSHYDSLNYRPVLYTYHKVLPLLDPMYDPAYLHIPKEIQELLLVRDHKDIEDKVKYYEQRPQEREDILDFLWNHFEIDKWKNPEYIDSLIKSYWS